MTHTSIFYVEVTDEDVMEDQIYVLPENWIMTTFFPSSKTCENILVSKMFAIFIVKSWKVRWRCNGRSNLCAAWKMDHNTLLLNLKTSNKDMKQPKTMRIFAWNKKWGKSFGDMRPSKFLATSEDILLSKMIAILISKS